MPISVQCLDPAHVPGERLDPLLDLLHRQVLASAALDQPHEPPPTPALSRGRVLTPFWGDPVRLLVAVADGDPVGHAVVELPVHDNRHLGLVEVHVALEARRRGCGRALLDAAARLLLADGRRSLVLEARVDSPAEALAAAVGAHRSLLNVRRSQRIAELDPARVAALRGDAERAAAGYAVEVWTGPTSAHRLAVLAAAAHALNDAPLGDLDVEDEVWDPERIAARDRAVLACRLRMHTALALAPHGGPAGYTEVAVSEDGTYGWQWGTGVDPAHRGHRLGLLLKTVMVERLRAAEPALRVVSTWNADSNRHMIAVNEALGYEPVDQMCEWQLDLRGGRPPTR